MMRSYYYNFLLCLCLFVSLSFHLVKAKWKYLTYLMFKWPYMHSTKINPRTYLQIYTAHAHPDDPNFTWFCYIIIIVKVHIAILKRPQNFAKSPPIIWLAVHKTNNWWRFRKILWPSQNIWTLIHIHTIFTFDFIHLFWEFVA